MFCISLSQLRMRNMVALANTLNNNRRRGEKHFSNVNIFLPSSSERSDDDWLLLLLHFFFLLSFSSLHLLLFFFPLLLELIILNYEFEVQFQVQLYRQYFLAACTHALGPCKQLPVPADDTKNVSLCNEIRICSCMVFISPCNGKGRWIRTAVQKCRRLYIQN